MNLNSVARLGNISHLGKCTELVEAIPFSHACCPSFPRGSSVNSAISEGVAPN